VVLNVDECVALAMETVDPLVRSSHHTLEIERWPKDLLINVDKDRVTQCLTNLLNNAVKYSQPGSRIRLKTYAQNGAAHIEVQDFGRGIRSEVLPHIFDLFAQGHNTLDRRNGGLGIGLSVCKRLVEMHGGSISAYSAGEGSGATFRLTFPLATMPPDERARPDPAPKSGGKRVLIVDDNQDAAQTIAMLLQFSGHETQVVFHGREALQLWKSFQPDVVVLDIGLPDLSGYEVAAQLRASGFLGVAVALSGYGQPEDKRRALSSGFNCHLVKPVEPLALENALQAIQR
jgi:CheY-like chemotaxis protein